MNVFCQVDREGKPKIEGIWEARCKFLARIMLGQKRVVLWEPNYEEWCGLCYLERDGEI